MEMQDRLSTLSGGTLALFFYIKIIYGNWDAIVFSIVILSFLFSLFFGYRQYRYNTILGAGK